MKLTIEIAGIQIKYVDVTRADLNYVKIPVTRLKHEQINKLVDFLNEYASEDPYCITSIPRTASGGIMKKSKYYHYGFEIDARDLRHYEILICHLPIGDKFITARIQPYEVVKKANLDWDGKYKKKMSGHYAYNVMLNELKVDGIDIHDYCIADGEDVKKTISKPLIDLIEAEIGQVYDNVIHIDINSAYPYFMSTFENGAFKKTIDRMYMKRHENEDYKLAMNASIGYFQSEWCRYGKAKYALANISKWCIDGTVNYVLSIANKYKNSGKLLAYNTDGIWIALDPSINAEEFKLKNSSDKLGGYKVDILASKIRFKSKGAYEYIALDGSYHPVYRGYTQLDVTKKRKNWEWGDILFTDLLLYEIDEFGHIKQREEEQ